MANLTLNKYYTFSVYANSVLGTTYRKAKLVSILDYSVALKFANVELLHKQVYPYLPPETTQDHTRYSYYLFKYKDKDVVLADVWIDQTTIQESFGETYTIRLNDSNTDTLNHVKNMLRLLGVSFDILDD